jgi:hypothetical protein
LSGRAIQVSDDQAHALLAICSANVELVTSDKMLHEVLKSQSLPRRALLTIVASLASRVPHREIATQSPGGFGVGAFGVTAFGGIGPMSRDPLLTSLLNFFESDDAEHIFQAVNSGCSYFLTLDEDTILTPSRAHRKDLLALCRQMEFVDPVTLAASL